MLGKWFYRLKTNFSGVSCIVEQIFARNRVKTALAFCGGNCNALYMRSTDIYKGDVIDMLKAAWFFGP